MKSGVNQIPGTAILSKIHEASEEDCKVTFEDEIDVVTYEYLVDERGIIKKCNKDKCMKKCHKKGLNGNCVGPKCLCWK